MPEPMQRTPWLNVLIVLLTIIAAAFMAQMLWSLLGQFSDIILLFVLAWLVAFALGPLIKRIDGKPLPSSVVMLAERLFGHAFAPRLDRFRFTRLPAVAVVYVSLALILIEVVAVLVPPVLLQLKQLTDEFPQFAKSASDVTPTLLRVLADIGFRSSDVSTTLSGALGSLQNLATLALQNTFVILGGAVALVGNLLLVLFLSFFFALDGPRLFRTLFGLVPKAYDDDVRMLAVTVDRTFGGYIRATLLQAFLVGAGTGIVMGIFGEPFILVASLFAGFFMLIPFVGTALALVPPVLATLSHDPGQVLLVLIILLVYQLLVSNVVMPKLLSEALGLHPLIIIASLLIGIKIGGFWGAFFGVPVAGVVATMALFFYRRSARGELPADEERAAVREPPPPSAVASLQGASPANVTPPAGDVRT
jgi:predicted PurR-regulated permease PerM